MNYRHHSAITPQLYNYHVDIAKAEGAYFYSVSFALNNELTDRHNARGSAPSIAACLDDITTWREQVISDAALLDGDK